MGTRLLYTITATGGIHGLLKDEVLDTSKFGHRKIERITEIKFDETVQKFYIQWLKGYYADRPWTGYDYSKINPTAKPEDYQQNVIGILLFDTYADAVAHEIECVNLFRKKGCDFI